MGRYGVKAVENTILGEGLMAGRRAVRVGVSGCNFWDGHPLHRHEAGTAPCARWCDADFYKGAVLDEEALLAAMEAAWPWEQRLADISWTWEYAGEPRIEAAGLRWCWLTGGEPLLQVDRALLLALHRAGWAVAVETNGSLAPPYLEMVDHLCVSPKHGAPCVVTRAEELKVVLPGAAFGEPGWADGELDALAKAGTWGALYVQPQDVLAPPDVVGATLLRGASSGDESVDEALDAAYRQHLARATGFVMRHPAWRLSVQAQKFVGLP